MHFVLCEGLTRFETNIDIFRNSYDTLYLWNFGMNWFQQVYQ